MQEQSYQVDESIGGDGLGAYAAGADGKEGIVHLTEEQIEGIEKIKKLKQASALISAPEESKLSDAPAGDGAEEVNRKAVEKSSSDVDNKGVPITLIVVCGVVSLVLIYGAYRFYMGKVKKEVVQ